MKHILLLATGGTIASRPTAAGGLAPMITSDELLACVPELAGVCHMDAVQLFNLDSTSVGPEQWAQIAAEVRRRYDDYDGFVITHGTDTMAYTAAALSYMIQRSPKPVVLTGSQLPIEHPLTDALENLPVPFRMVADFRLNVSEGLLGVRAAVPRPGRRGCGRSPRPLPRSPAYAAAAARGPGWSRTGR